MFQTAALMQGLRWRGGGLQSFLQQQQEKSHVLPFLLLTGSSASADGYSPYQLPGMRAGCRQNQTYSCSTSMRTDIQNQGHIQCCRLLEASLACSSHTCVPRYLHALQYRRVQTLAPQNTGTILRVGKHPASKQGLCVWAWLD